MARGKLTPKESDIIQALEDAGLLTKEFLSEKTLKAIGSLSKDQVKVLKAVDSTVSLSAFINAKGPQV
jgi:hypothetical protein